MSIHTSSGKVQTVYTGVNGKVRKVKKIVVSLDGKIITLYEQEQEANNELE